jgi:DNA-binding transcriptional MerR regulator
MGYPATIIPEKLFFKIGEVCDIVGVQAHVLRYWETEFPMLSPQKNRSGQRTYRRRDVEIALRIKELLYEEMYTIAGAKKKLQAELREASRLKIVPPVDKAIERTKEPVEKQEKTNDYEEDNEHLYYQGQKHFEEEFTGNLVLTEERREALRKIASELLELREMLKNKPFEEEKPRFGK